MVQQLWFLRHGEAEPHGARGDFDRNLTARGERQARSAGRALAALQLTFQLVVTSPKIRARETAVLACKFLDCDPVDHEPLTEGFDLDDVIELIAAVGQHRRILLVGHNPDFTNVIQDLTGARVDLRKGAVAGVRLGDGGGELIAMLRPRELDRIR